MNNKNLERINLLLKIAKQKTTVSAVLLAKANHALSKEEKNLIELQKYQQDYMAVMANHLHTKTTTLQLKTDQLFLDHLSDVINQQELTLQSVMTELDKRKELWRKCYQREKALNKYHNKVKENVLCEIELKEQRLVDTESTSYWTYKHHRSKVKQ